MILGNDSPLSCGGSVIVHYPRKIGVEHTLKHLKIAITLSVIST
jgi:hypothetical protein